MEILGIISGDEELNQTYRLSKMGDCKEDWVLHISELTQTLLDEIIGSSDLSSLSIWGDKRREQCRLDNIDFARLAKNKNLKGLGIHGMSGTIDLTPLVNVSRISVQHQCFLMIPQFLEI
jgi:hypothetical protein